MTQLLPGPRPRLLGLVFRMLGPIIEILSVFALLRFRGRGLRLAGVPVETLCFLGFGLGLVLVFAGLWLSYASPRRARPAPRYDLDLGTTAEADSDERVI